MTYYTRSAISRENFVLHLYPVRSQSSISILIST